ncbi:hypothetical protein VB796_06475 [Arcicella sp. LKC2W]|uniref:hypothetical protein n=1 Tax=Arcicella sp. LKC2W TaxID=2984198 RepID=UPI002B1F84A2|nr:hypothetical protein [Arcicella sp. LKC2W]MEA5458672.1 hypothetical protein [Arcicella sp. LKC2W]
MAQDNQVFVQMPPLNVSEATMLKTGIIRYLNSYPDSVQSSIYDNLKQISQFIEAQSDSSTAEMRFQNIPMKVINYVEQQYYGGSIIEWSEAKDSEIFRVKANKAMIESMLKEVEQVEEKMKCKKSFRCKYFSLMGVPCSDN